METFKITIKKYKLFYDEFQKRVKALSESKEIIHTTTFYDTVNEEYVGLIFYYN